ncbi:PREDICTED: uncharacterized protein LOC109593372 [Amphimedon queenslandica]|uniref:Uncharacterized protein n=2 Tax=Amphimedon queenslandica TaxID=400682 RepID=A0AAN0K3W1_AMPQE|nr:PREDICTED: uncharacterized protein LOC109593372 [Amphimedon queenslandica]|eukprot:XP_019864035.1 PREDICTED: uncharacterized protein LOC109593372 [Amphimedon queenslandica]
MKIKINRSLKELLAYSVGTKDGPNPQNDIKKHLNDLKHFLSTSEAMFCDKANGCKEERVINTSQYNELFDRMNRQSLSERVDLFIRKIAFLLELCPDQFSKFLSILNIQEDIALSTLAGRIAASLERRQ